MNETTRGVAKTLKDNAGIEKKGDIGVTVIKDHKKPSDTGTPKTEKKAGGVDLTTAPKRFFCKQCSALLTEKSACSSCGAKQ